MEGGIVVSLHTTTRVPRSPPSSVFVHQYIPFPYTFVYKDSLPKYLYFVCPADNGNQKKKRNRKGATREKGVCVCALAAAAAVLNALFGAGDKRDWHGNGRCIFVVGNNGPNVFQPL